MCCATVCAMGCRHWWKLNMRRGRQAGLTLFRLSSEHFWNLGLALRILPVPIVGIGELATWAELNVVESTSIGMVNAGFDPVQATKGIAVVNPVPQIEASVVGCVQGVSVLVEPELLCREIPGALTWRNDGAAVYRNRFPVGGLVRSVLHGRSGSRCNRKRWSDSGDNRVDTKLEAIPRAGGFIRNNTKCQRHPGPLTVLEGYAALNNVLLCKFSSGVRRISGALGLGHAIP